VTSRLAEGGTGLGVNVAWYVLRDMGAPWWGIEAGNVKNPKGGIFGGKVSFTLPMV